MYQSNLGSCVFSDSRKKTCKHGAWWLFPVGSSQLLQPTDLHQSQRALGSWKSRHRRQGTAVVVRPGTVHVNQWGGDYSNTFFFEAQRKKLLIIRRYHQRSYVDSNCCKGANKCPSHAPWRAPRNSPLPAPKKECPIAVLGHCFQEILGRYQDPFSFL